MAFTPDPIVVPNIPAALLITGDESDPMKALKYRTQTAQYSAAFLNIIAKYMTGFSTNLDELVMPAMTGDEQNALNKLYDQSNDLVTDLGPLRDAIITALDKDLITAPPDFDIQAVIDLIISHIEQELGSSTNDIATFRALLKSIIDLALMDSSYQILGSESIIITNSVNAFISRGKSTLDQKYARLDRKTINELDFDGTLDSSIAAEVIARAQQDKARDYLEVEYKGEELRIEWTNEAFDRAIERMKTKISAAALLPVDLIRLPSALYDLLGDLMRRRFFDRNTFLNNYPNMIAEGFNGLEAVARLRQNDRHVTGNYSLEVGKTVIQLFLQMSQNLQSIASSIAKLSTFEAS